MNTFVLNTSSLSFTEEEFFRFCQDNDNLRFERTADKQIIVMAPTGSETGLKNSDINFELALWNRRTKLGYVFDSNTGFTLPNMAVRSPDASWIRKDRWEKLEKLDQSRFAHICPDFVIELKSNSDELNYLKDKMKEWMENGCRLAWLICPQEETAFIYRPLAPIEEITSFNFKLSGEEVLPGFELELAILR